MIYDALLAGAIGSLLCLDRLQLLQAMLSRPIVCGPIVGFALGSVEAGVATGVLYELFWLRKPPVGGYIPPDTTVVAIAGTAVCAILRPETAGAGVKSLAFLIFLCFLPIAYVSARMDNRFRRYLAKPAKSAAERAEAGESGIWVYVLSAIGLGFLLNFALLFSTILIGGVILREIVSGLSPRTLHAFDFAYYVIPALGIIDLMIGLHERRFYFIFLTGFLVSLIGGLVIISLG